MLFQTLQPAQRRRLIRTYFATAMLASISCAQSIAQAPSPTQWSPTDASQDQEFGESVDVDGGVAVVGAFNDSEGSFESGAAYLFRFDGAQWQQEQKFIGSQPGTFDNMGQSVAVSGDVAILSASGNDVAGLNAGAAYVFRNDGTSWHEEILLTASDAAERDNFGTAVDIDGDVAVVGSASRDGAEFDAGAVYVYRYMSGQWNEEAILTASDGGLQDLFGSAVAIDGDRILVGAFFAADTAGTRVGKVYAFDYDGSEWSQTQILRPGDPRNLQQFGLSVALEGEWIIVGASLDDEEANGAGAAYFFRYDGSTWIQHSKVTASDWTGFNLFGTSVTISGTRAAVGAENWFPGGGDATGKVYVFEYDDVQDEWAESYGVVPPNGTAGDGFGQDVVLDGEFMLVGSPDYDQPVDGAGAAFAYGMASVSTSVDRGLPVSAFSLSAPYPNPFLSATEISISLKVAEDIRVAIFDAIGREVLVPFEGRLPAGSSHRIAISGDGLPSGVFVVRVTIGSAYETRLVARVR